MPHSNAYPPLVSSPGRLSRRRIRTISYINRTSLERIFISRRGEVMSSATIEVERAGSEPRNRKLASWVEEVAQLCKLEQVYWCDGSVDEYATIIRRMILSD